MPRVVHFVYGLSEHQEPFSFMSYVAVESARRVLEPDAIHLHHHHAPYGPWWDMLSPHVLTHPVEPVAEVLGAEYDEELVPAQYLYAHHADFIRLDVLLRHGGVYADLDTIFVRPIPDELYDCPFVLGREQDLVDPRTGQSSPSLCNALLMSSPGAAFAEAWRQAMPGALDGTWSHHSGTLAYRLSAEMPEAVRVEPRRRFYPFGYDRDELAALFLGDRPLPADTVSVHLWAHLWWSELRNDTPAHAGWFSPSVLRRARTTLAALVRPYLPPVRERPVIYLGLDETSGYGVAGRRNRDALEAAGRPVDWVPLVPARPGLLPYAAATRVDPLRAPGFRGTGEVVVAHVMPEYLPEVRSLCPDAALAGYTAWETSRVPRHWLDVLPAADRLLVPSAFSADVLAEAGVPVEVVAHVVVAPEPARARPGWLAVPEDVVVFYTVGDWNARKGVDLTVEAYLRAFSASDPVLLVVRTSPLDRRRALPPGAVPAVRDSTAWVLAEMLARHPGGPAVRLVTRPLDGTELAGLHLRGDCFVSLTRGEAWGLAASEAAAWGNPVVMTAYGGQLEYLHGSPHLVPYRLVAVDDPAGGSSYTPDQRWADPDLDAAVEQMRQIASDPAAARRGAAPLAEDMTRRFAPLEIGARLDRILREMAR